MQTLWEPFDLVSPQTAVDNLVIRSFHIIYEGSDNSEMDVLKIVGTLLGNGPQFVVLIFTTSGLQ